MRPGDPKRHWEKADAVREVVDAALGIAAGPLRQAAASEAYLMVAEKRVVGFLLAEPLEATDRLERSFLRGGSRVVASPGKVRNLAKCCKFLGLGERMGIRLREIAVGRQREFKGGVLASL